MTESMEVEVGMYTSTIEGTSQLDKLATEWLL
jgi:hypothetical protein